MRWKKSAMVRHKRECSVDAMENVVAEILGMAR